MTLPGKGLPEGLPPPTVALLTDVFSATLIFSLFLPVTLLLQSVLNFDSSSCDCCVITLLISIMVPRFPPICHLLGSTIVVKDETVELSVRVTSVFGHLICTCHRLNKVIWEIAELPSFFLGASSGKQDHLKITFESVKL